MGASWAATEHGPSPETVHSYAPDASLYPLEPPLWLDELDLSPSPPHLHMGTKAIPMEDWLVVDGAMPAELTIRARLLDDRPDDVLAVLSSADEAAFEVLELVRAAVESRPDASPFRGASVASDATNAPQKPGGAGALDAAGRMVVDDLCLLIRHDDAWHLDGAVLCFATFWSLSDKLGAPMDLVHAPVAHYDPELTGRLDRFFDRLPVDRVVRRRNVSFCPGPYLWFPPVTGLAPDRPIAADGSPWWLRSERQTLRRLPRSGAVLFAIRVQHAPLGVLLRRPDIARALHDMADSWDDAMRAYKVGAADLDDNLLPWLRAAAEGGSGTLGP